MCLITKKLHTSVYIHFIQAILDRYWDNDSGGDAK